MFEKKMLRATVLAMALAVLCPAHAADTKSVNVPAGDLTAALQALVKQSGVELVYRPEQLKGLKTRGVQGSLSSEEAVRKLIEGTPLTLSADPSGVLLISAATAPVKTSAEAGLAEDLRLARSGNGENLQNVAAENPPAVSEASAGQKAEEGSGGISEILVTGSKVINLDVPRTRDDVQPYVVFDSEQIQASQASNLGDFFRTRLPMATPSGPAGGGAFGVNPQAASSINLRGLGTEQTLILVDGRPLPPRSGGGTNVSQADVNGIPLAMIERVEILPSTASGIYGGGATGGVINIITRKDFSGATFALNYLNTFDTDSGQRRADFTASTNLRGGDTALTLTASYADANALLVGDRGFARRARELGWRNLPQLFLFPPIAGYTTNISSQTGENLVLKPQYGGAELSSGITYIPAGYAGVASDNAAALVANSGRYNLDLPVTSFGARAPLVATNPVKSLGLSARQKITPWLEGYADYFQSVNSSITNVPGAQNFATLDPTAPNNPFTTAINVSFPLPGIESRLLADNDSTRISAGLIARLSGGWQTAVDYTRGRARSRARTTGLVVGDPDGSGPAPYYQDAIASGVLDVMRDLNARPLDLRPYLMPAEVSDFISQDYTSITQAVTLRASGPVYRLPAGDIVVSTSLDWKQDRNDDSVNGFWPGETSPTLSYFYTPSTSQTNRSAYAEARVPLLAAPGGGRQSRLEMQLAARYDVSRTRTFSDGFDPSVPGREGPFPSVDGLAREVSDTTYTAGLRFVVLPDVTLRASIGTGFLAPSRAQLSSGVTQGGAFYFNTVDPKRGFSLGTIGPVTVLSGGDADLRPEQSESLSAGAIFTPRVLPGLRLSVDYTRITKTDEITSLSLQQMLDSEDFLPGALVRAPLTPSEQALGYTGGVITQVDFRQVNLARREVEAVDLQADYTRVMSIGTFHFHGIATWNRRFAQQVTPVTARVDSVGFYAGPLKWSGNAGIDWTRGSWTAGWNVHYYGRQRVYSAPWPIGLRRLAITATGTDHYPEQFYNDAQVAYRFGKQAGGWRRLFDDVRVSVGVQNVFNAEPPLSVFGGGFGSTQPLEDPRLRRYSLNFQRDF